MALIDGGLKQLDMRAGETLPIQRESGVSPLKRLDLASYAEWMPSMPSQQHIKNSRDISAPLCTSAWTH